MLDSYSYLPQFFCVTIELRFNSKTPDFIRAIFLPPKIKNNDNNLRLCSAISRNFLHAFSSTTRTEPKTRQSIPPQDSGNHCHLLLLPKEFEQQPLTEFQFFLKNTTTRWNPILQVSVESWQAERNCRILTCVRWNLSTMQPTTRTVAWLEAAMTGMLF